MKKKIVPILCALVLSAASNGAYAMTKAELRNGLAQASVTVNGSEVKPTQSQLSKVNLFLDQCGDLTEDQYEAMYDFTNKVSTLITQRNSGRGMSLEDINKDPDVIAAVTAQINLLKEKIPGLHVELKDGCAFLGTAVLNGAHLEVSDLKALLAGSEEKSSESSSKGNSTESSSKGNSTEDSSKDATSQNSSKSNSKETTKTSTPAKSSKRVIKSTGSNVDLSALSLTAAISLLGIAAGALMARKKRLFEVK